MSDQLPLIEKGEQITADWLNHFARANRPIRGSADIVPQYGPTSVTLHFARKRRSSNWQPGLGDAGSAFRVYHHVPDPENPDADDWRTTRVWGAGATINGQHASNDDLQGSPLVAVIPASQTNYKFWLEISIEDAAGGTQGNVTAAIIKHGSDPTANGWAAYPSQPAGDSGTGDPPDKYFVLLTDHITTSNDDDKVLVLPSPQTTNTAIAVAMYGFDISCEDGSLALHKKLTHHVVAGA